jgi:hypothetical protein
MLSHTTLYFEESARTACELTVAVFARLAVKLAEWKCLKEVIHKKSKTLNTGTGGVMSGSSCYRQKRVAIPLVRRIAHDQSDKGSV